MTVKFTNNASTTVATGINTTATSLVVASAAGFPALSGSGDYCYLTIQQAAGTNVEVVKATALSSNTFTIVRAQDGTSAGSWSVSDVVELRVTAALLTDIVDAATHDASVLSVDSTNNRVGVNDTTPSVTLDISGTDAIALPVGTTAERPTGAAGRFRYNSSLSQFEGYTDAWGAIGGGGTNTFTTDTFTANGSLVAFNLSQTVASANNLLCFIDGVFQTQDAYSIATASGTTTLTFSAAPANGRKIVVYSVAAGISGANLNIDSMTGDGSDVTLTLTINTIKENTQVFIDGVYQAKANYSISGTTLTFSTAPPAGSAVECVTMTQTEINVPVDGTVTSAKLSGDLTTPGALTVTGNMGVGTTSTYNMKTTIAGTGSALSTGTGSYAVASIYDTATAAAGTGGGLAFQGDDGTNSAVTFATVNGSKENATSGNYASYLGFSTRANGGNLTEKVRIDSAGNMKLITANDTAGTSKSLTFGTNSFNRAEIKCTNAATYDGSLEFYTGNASNFAERLRIDSTGAMISSMAGGVFLKNSSGGTSATQILVSNTGGSMRAGVESSSGGTIQTGTSAYAAVFGNQGNYPTQFTTNGTVKATIDSSGRFLVNTTSILSGTSAKLQVLQDIGGQWSQRINNSSSTPFGLTLSYTGASPNNTSSHFIYCDDTAAARFYVMSNGNVLSATNSYGSTSDLKLKENIVDASSQWDDLKAVRVRKYSFKEENSSEPTQIGVIAQEVEAAGMAGLVYETADQEIAEDGSFVDTGEVTKTMKYSILYMKAIKALQEAMERIETLEAKVQTLENN